MTSTPQRISRSQTPSPSPRLVPPQALRSPSVSSLHGRITPSRMVSQAQLTALPPRLHVTSATHTTFSSPASSVINVELSDSILLREVAGDEGDLVENEEMAEGTFSTSTDNEVERKKTLRDQLRRTLSRKDTEISLRPARRKGKEVDPEETIKPAEELYPQRQYFIITDAGKPVFKYLLDYSRPRTADEDLTSITGITSALISVFADNTLSPSPYPSSGTDKLRCINAGSTRITFFLRPPLYYVCVSKWKEPESVARMHLEYLHLQILSVITASQLRRIFERRTNFDLRRLLEGAESFLHTLISRLQSSLAFCATLSALSSLRLDALLRSRAGDALVPNSKTGNLDILYTVLISGDSVITLVRPKKHSVHPIDLHILLNALHNPSIAATPASWLPICLPKFNPQGFVHAYVSFLEHEQTHPLVVSSSSVLESEEGSAPVSSALNGVETSTGPIGSTAALHHDGVPNEDHNFPPQSNVMSETHGPEIDSSESVVETDPDTHYENRNEKEPYNVEFSNSRNGLTLVIVSGGGEFDAVRKWSESISKKLETTGLMSLLKAATEVAPYTCSELGIPGLRHFLYKSRVHVQTTSPLWDEEYHALDSRRRLITLYQTLHDAIHAKSGQEVGLKLQYIRTDKEAVMGWITQPFELYVAVSPRLPKSAVVGAANAVARWVKREEPNLFLRDAPIF